MLLLLFCVVNKGCIDCIYISLFMQMDYSHTSLYIFHNNALYTNTKIQYERLLIDHTRSPWMHTALVSYFGNYAH